YSTRAGRGDPRGRRCAPGVIDADHRSAAGRHAGHQALLDGRVVVHRAVAIEVVFAEIDEHADGRIDRGREIDLIGGTLDHVVAARPRAREAQARPTAVAPATGSPCRCCRPSARPCRPPGANALSAPWWWTCRWCR